MNPLCTLSLLALLLPTTALAQAQDDGFDGHGFMQAPGDGDLDDLLITWRPEKQVPFSFGAAGLFEYADSPVVLHYVDGENQSTEILVDNLFGLNLGLSTAVHERVGISLSAPLWFSSLAPNGEKMGLGFGDMRLYVPIGIVLADEDETGGGVGISVVPLVHLPSGNETRMLGNGGFGAGLIGVFGYNTGPLAVSMNLGVEANPSMEYENLRGGANLLTAFGASYRLAEDLSGRLEARFDPSLKKNTYRWTESPGEVLLSARGRYASGASWTLGAASGLTKGVTAAKFRFFAGFGWTFGKEADIDADGDGILDSLDQCPAQVETVNDYLDEDGCPDMLSTFRLTVRAPTGKLQPGALVKINGEEVGRTDENGVIDLVDQVPGTELDIEIEPHAKTGMEPFSLADVILEEGKNDEQVELLWMPGAVKVVTRSQEGAIVDSVVTFRGPAVRADEPVGEDGEEIFVLEPGEWTLLISAPTFGTERRELVIKPNQRSLVLIEVTLEPAVVEITDEEVIILEQILFEFDSADIKHESAELVEEIASTLITHPTIRLVEVQGHTDDKGSARYNRDLSQRRVESVVEAMVELGVERERLVAKGFGEDKPIAPNTTDEGRAKNRRVQFIILEQGEVLAPGEDEPTPE